MNFKNINKMKTHHSLFTIFCFDFLNTPFFTSLKYLKNKRAKRESKEKYFNERINKKKIKTIIRDEIKKKYIVKRIEIG
jgi:hypothetical protein